MESSSSPAPPGPSSSTRSGPALCAPVEATKIVVTVESSSTSNVEEGEVSIQKRGPALLTGTSTVFDVFLTTTAAAVGQSILMLPTSMTMMGLAAGTIWEILFHTISVYTGYLMSALFIDFLYLKDSLREGEQLAYHEMIGTLIGSGWVTIAVKWMCVFALFGLTVVQFIASSSNLYLLSDYFNKQEYALIFGGICFPIVFLKDFGHMRILTFLGLLATTYTAFYLFTQSLVLGRSPDPRAVFYPRVTVDSFFEGSGDIIFTFSGHAMLIEVMSNMKKPSDFGKAFTWSWAYVLAFLTLPHAISVYVNYGSLTLLHHNALALMPPSPARSVAVILMVAHEGVALALFALPLFFAAEKFFHLHHKSIWKKLPVRSYVYGLAWFFSIAFPFFGPMNAILGSLFASWLTYILPAAAHLWVYRTPEKRAACHMQPWKPKFMWPLMMVMNWVIVLGTVVVGFGVGSYFAFWNLIVQSQLFAVFSPCYQCPLPIPILPENYSIPFPPSPPANPANNAWWFGADDPKPHSMNHHG